MDSVGSSRSIHVGNLSPYIDSNMLKTIFGCIGTIEDVRIAAGGKFGFIDFLDAETARTALNLNGTEIGGQKIRVELTQTRRLNTPAGGMGMGSMAGMVGGGGAAMMAPPMNPLAALGLNMQVQVLYIYI
mmetsp:Transcript_22981/g.38072  ORF Transcript_22981/g.38072 Transcript_22981/m.38072 type:complete len:130 (-) Transcript_22981:2053-2442(-)